jgi:DNA-binding IclR family transcriptional regulator
MPTQTPQILPCNETVTHENGAEGVTSVLRALSILDAFTLEQSRFTLADLSLRVGLPKPTTLRLARTLALNKYLKQETNGTWRLGSASGWLGARYQATFDINHAVEPALRDLVKQTGESASLFVREESVRVCVARVESPNDIRHHLPIGSAMALELGSPGRVILAYDGAAGEEFAQIRARGHLISIGERERDSASVSAPVFGPGGKFLGAISVSGPITRLTRGRLDQIAPTLTRATSRLSANLLTCSAR